MTLFFMNAVLGFYFRCQSSSQNGVIYELLQGYSHGRLKTLQKYASEMQFTVVLPRRCFELISLYATIPSCPQIVISVE